MLCILNCANRWVLWELWHFLYAFILSTKSFFVSKVTFAPPAPLQVRGCDQRADQWGAWYRLSHHWWHPLHDPSGSQAHTERRRYLGHSDRAVEAFLAGHILHAKQDFAPGFYLILIIQATSQESAMLSLSMMVGLIPIVSLFGLFYSASVEENFPQGCTSSSSLCFYSLLLPVTIPVYVFFHLWSWMGIKLFRHN